MKLLIRLAFKEILGHKKFSLFFIFNLSLGLVGFLSLDAFKHSFRDQLTSSSKNILTADLAVSARRKLSPKEMQITKESLPKGSQKQETISFYSMVASETKSRLVEIVGIQDSFPFYGDVLLKQQGKIKSRTDRSLNQKNTIWVYPEILVQLGVKVGDQLSIGKVNFTIEDVITDDVGLSWSGVSFAPKIYIGYSQINQTDLVKKGSTFWHSVLFKLAPSANLSDELANQLNHKLSDPGIRVKTHELEGEQTGRLISYLFDYLGLVALSGFFLAIIGVGYFYFSYFSKRLKDLSILLCLGLSSSQVIVVFLLQIMILSGAAACLSFLISLPAIKFYPLLFNSLLDTSISSFFSLETFIICLVVSILGSMLICSPLILKIKKLKPAHLFQEYAQMSVPFKPLDLVFFLPSLVLFSLLAIWQANSWVSGSLFMVSFLGGGLLSSFLFLSLVKIFSKKKPPQNFPMKMAFLYLTRQPFHALIAFTTISLGILLINTIDQIKNGLQNQLQQPESALPSFFLFDIQDEQLSSLQSYLKGKNKELTHVSPMIRARLTSINGKDFVKSDLGDGMATREEERENRMRNRGYNLSYRKSLADSEKIISGTFPSAYEDGKVAEVSLERRFASRLDLKLGDLLSFDVQGVDIEARVTSLREVRWTSFQPNFFIQFQDGVLNGAPKTWIAAVPQIVNADLNQLQTDLVKEFPNLSIIDVKRLVEKILEITNRMSFILTSMASVSFLVGLVILFSICHYQSRLRKWDMNLLKVIGSPVKTWAQGFYLEFGFICLLGTTVGVSGSLLISWLLAKITFDSYWLPDWQLPLLSLLIMLIIGLVCANIALKAVVRTRSAKQLNFED